MLDSGFWTLDVSTFVLAAVVMLLSTTAVSAGTISANTLTNLSFDQNLNTKIDLNLPFKDENGRDVILADYFGKKPVILDLGYYKCPMLCGLVLNGLVQSMDNLKPSVGKDFNIVCVSISPSETPDLAAAKRQTYLRRYGRENAGAGWHFLTGKEPAIKKLAAEAGFHYVYDPNSGQYAHPSGILILTPEGKIARYFFGVRYSSAKLAQALRDAGTSKVESPIQQFVLLCCSFVPLVGKYSATIMMIVRILGMIVLFALIGYVIRSALRPANQAPAPAPEPKEEVGRQ